MLALLIASVLTIGGGTPPPHDPEGRLAELSARIARCPNDAALRWERGRVHDALGDPLAARTDFVAALQIEPGHRGATFGLAAAEHRLGNETASLIALRRAASLGVPVAAVERLRGRVLAALHRPAEAAAAFGASVAASVGPRPESFLEWAAAEDAAAGPAHALAALERGLAACGPVVSLVDAAVAIDVRERAFDRALTRLESLRPFMPRPVPLLERRAAVLAIAGRLAEQCAELDLAARCRADGDDAVAPPVSAAPPRPPAIVAPLPPPAGTVLVPMGATWRYRDTGVWPGFGWEQPAYVDSAWSSGPAQLGYGDGDEATVIAGGPSGAHFPTQWFRHTFSVVDPTVFPTARVRLVCDDGAVVYVNGVEIARWNLANGFASPTGWASAPLSGADEAAVHTFAFPPTLLVPGSNVVAVEVHQSGPTSSDVSFALELAAGAEPLSLVRGPYVQDGTPTSAVVMWRTDQPSPTELWLGTTPQNLQPVFVDATPRTDHEAIATGLAPETAYHYRVGDGTALLPGQSSAQVFRTLPPAGAVRPLRVWALGDAGIGSASQLAVRDRFAAFAGAAPPDALLLLGDNAYFSGTDAEFQVGVFDVYRSYLASTFCWPTLGNHDAVSVVTAAQTGPYYDAFVMPKNGEAGGLPSGTEAYYSFDRGHVHFVCLDSMDSDRSAGGAMMTWLTADLAATNARWIVAFFHHPPYSFGSHDSDDPNDSGGRMTDMRAIALPILEAGGVDLVLAGHSHDYERSFLLDGHYGPSAALQPGMVLDRGDGAADDDGSYGKPTAGKAPHEGAVYVVAGSAGSTGGGALNHPAMHVGLDHLGSLVLDIDGDRLDATFVGTAAVEDHFTIVKGEPRTFFRDQPRVGVGGGGRQDWRLAAGPSQAGNIYGVLGSFATEPGFDIDNVHVPLMPDAWMNLSIGLANSPIYPSSFGFLDVNGAATSAFVLPPLNDPTLVGLVVWHAFLVLGGQGFTMASNPVRLTLLP